MIKQECIGIPDMILLLMIFCFKKIKIKAEIVLSPGGAYFTKEEPEPEVRKQALPFIPAHYIHTLDVISSSNLRFTEKEP